ncbi:hypothetical protein TNCV_213621 [Trichonephila clavipes]|nr:hypothetical protein TNCV_213621 [Trichonephila clavipes]
MQLKDRCEGCPEGGQGLTIFPLLPPTSRDDLWLDVYLEYSHAAKALYIYKHPGPLWDSNPGPMAQQLASLSTIPDEWHIKWHCLEALGNNNYIIAGQVSHSVCLIQRIIVAKSFAG